MSQPLFVYGTLMDGHAQAGLLAGLSRLPATVRGTLYELPAGYPALVTTGDGLVHGELVDPPAEGVLALLDRYEGVDEGLFRRVTLTAMLGLRGVAAWAWVMDRPDARGGRLLASGRWRAVRRR